MKIKNVFYCPHCFGNVSLSNKIVLKIKSAKSELGLIMLSAKINDYTSEISESVKMVEGAHYDFFCPLCSASLNLESVQKSLIKLFMKDKDNKKHEVLFSGVFGENCTYVLKDYNLEYFGSHSKKYIDQIEKYKEFYENHL